VKHGFNIKCVLLQQFSHFVRGGVGLYITDLVFIIYKIIMILHRQTVHDELQGIHVQGNLYEFRIWGGAIEKC